MANSSNSQSQATYVKMPVVRGWEVWPRKTSLGLHYEIKKRERLMRGIRPSVRMPVGDVLW